MSATPQPLFFPDESDNEAFSAKTTQGRLSARARGEEEQILLAALKKTHDVRLVAFHAVILGILLDMRFFFLPVLDIPHVSDRKRRQRAVEEELETTGLPETFEPKVLRDPFESRGLVLGGLARHESSNAPCCVNG